MTTYTSVYPPAHNDTYVKATNKVSTNYWAYFATDPTKSLINTWAANAWVSDVVTNQRFHIDLGSALIVRRIYYENGHTSGTYTNAGAQNFTIQGSDSSASFAELTYATDTGWTTIDSDTFVKHVAANSVDPQYVLIDNTAAYRYYALKIANNYTDGTYLGMRRITLQTEDGYGGVAFRSGVIWF